MKAKTTNKAKPIGKVPKTNKTFSKKRVKKLTGKAFLDSITGGFENTPGTTEEIMQWLKEQG